MPSPFGNKKIVLPRQTEMSAAEILWQQGKQCIARLRHDLAQEPLRKLLSMEPAHPLAPAALAVSLLKMRRFEEGLEQAREAVRLRPSYGFAHFAMAIALGSTKDFEGAFEHARQAITLCPTMIAYYSLAPSMHLTLEQFDQVVIGAERGLAIKPDEPLLQCLRALGLAGTGRGDEAKLAIKEVLRMAPANPLVHQYAGHVHRVLKEYDLSEAFYRSSMKINAQLPGSHAGLGLIRFELGRWDEAKPFLEEAIRVAAGEEDPEVTRALAKINTAVE